MGIDINWDSELEQVLAAELLRHAADVAIANAWERMSYGNAPAFEKFGPDYDGAVHPRVAAELAKDSLREAGLD